MTRTILFFIWFTSTCAAATISGHVTAPASHEEPPPRYVERPTAHEHAHDVTDAVPMCAVVVEPLDIAGVTPPLRVPDAPLTMAQEGTAFEPNLLVVPVGGVVSFPNHDPIFHNVFSYSATKSFDLGRYPKGETRTVTFSDPGIVRVFCEIHPSMYASIIVSPSPWYTLVPSGSEFRFTDLPAGKYRILAANAAGRHSLTEVTVSPSETRSLSIVLGM